MRSAIRARLIAAPSGRRYHLPSPPVKIRSGNTHHIFVEAVAELRRRLIADQANAAETIKVMEYLQQKIHKYESVGCLVQGAD